MASLARLMALLLAATAVSAQPEMKDKRGMAERLQVLLKDCWSAAGVDEASFFGDCQGVGSLECIAAREDFTGSSGYDEDAAEDFVDRLSQNATWTDAQKEALGVCSSMTEDIPTEQQGVFVFVCWIKMQMIECNRNRLVAAVEELNVDGGKEVAETVATMVEGSCFKCGLQYGEEIKDAWKTCASDAGVDKRILRRARKDYKHFSRGKEVQLTAEKVTAVAEQLGKLETAVDCYLEASGEVSGGEVNYEKILSIIEEATGNDAMKAAAEKLVEYCQDQEPSTVKEFHTCYFEHQPYACAVLKARDIATGSENSACSRRS